MLHALVRPTGPELASCELTHLEREPIDVERAVRQHEVYVQVLRDLGVRVHELPRLPDHPDAVFVEDPVLVLDEIAVALRPGAASRRGEVDSVVEALLPHRDVVRVEEPATIDGGDIAVLGTDVLVGVTSRTSTAGIEALRAAIGPHGYHVVPVGITGCLHLKTALTPIDDDTVVVHEPWVVLDDLDRLGRPIRRVPVPDHEPHGANVLAIGDTVLAQASAEATHELLAGLGRQVVGVDTSELAKAEGALTCGSVLFVSD